MSSADAAVAEEGAHDDIDFFLANEDARPSYDDLDDAELRGEGMETLQSTLVELGATVALTTAKFLAQMAVRRVDCVVTVQSELVRDGRLSGPLAGPPETAAAAPGNGGSSAGVRRWSPWRHVAGGFVAVQRCARRIVRTGGATALLRGGRAFACFTVAGHLLNNIAAAALQQLLAPAVGPLSGPAEAVWVLGVTPLLLHCALWPLKAVRAAVMTNYMADIVAPAPKRAAAATGSAAEGGSAGPRPDGEEEEGDDDGVYLYDGVGEVWAVVLRRMGWRGLLANGCGVELARAYTVVATRLLMNVGFARMLSYMSTPAEERWLGPVGVAVTIHLSVGFVNGLLRPFHVIATRMALLPPHDDSDDDNNSNAESRGRVRTARAPLGGCRYRGGLHCAQTILREEGVLGLFAGYGQAFLVQTLLPLARTLVFGTFLLSFSGEGA